MRTSLHAACFCAFALLAVGRPSRASAEIWFDPEPPLAWDAALACELVVLARYESHEDKTVTLAVVEVLKGDADRKTVVADLQHLYSVETGPVGWESFDKRGEKGDKVPRICYKQQIMNPGSPVPMAIRKDAREPALYFFPDQSKPALKIHGQVQSPLFKTGWRQAIDGKPSDLLFRLTQRVNRELSRDALEELGKTRDGASLDQLFAWIVDRPEDDTHLYRQAVSHLSRVGDRSGDVYNRARRLVIDAAPGANEYRFFSLARIMAIVDPDRAWADLSQLVGGQFPLPVRKGALAGIGRIPKREAAQLALEKLRDADLAQHALAACRTQLQGENDYEYPRFRGLSDDRSWMMDELRKAAQDEQVPAETRKEIARLLDNVSTGDMSVDLEALRHELLNTESALYRGRIENQTAKLLREAKQACDPRVIPILVEALDTVPQASGHQSYSLPDLLHHYALICPHATRKELEKRGVPDRLAGIRSYERNFKIHEALETAGLWPPREPDRRAEEVAAFQRLAIKVRGRRAAEEELLEAADKLVQNRAWRGLSALLDANSPAAEARFYDYLEQKKQRSRNRISGELQPDFDLVYVLDALYPGHPDVFVEEILKLFRSPSLAERRKGVETLKFTLQTDLDFDPAALEADRNRHWAEVEPLLRRVGQVSEPQARVILLKRSGYSVMGGPDETWLPMLIDAVGSRDNVAPHALRLIETVVGEPRCRKFEHFPPAERRAAVRAYLNDMGKLPE